MDKFLRLKIKTKLTFGIGLLFTMIVLLGGLAVQNITDMSSDTQNILADNYNSLLYSRRMLDALERIKNDPQARAEFEKNLDLQQRISRRSTRMWRRRIWSHNTRRCTGT